MDAERWKRIDEIFHAALDCEPSARASFITKACKEDESLRSEIEALIASHEKESSFFETPPSELAAELLAKKTGYEGKIGHYQILKKIGSGGMGEVYLAEDTRLNRRVALKLLPPEFTKDSDRIRRFEREARAVSALNHPNILTIYDVGQIDSSSFIASEFIDGETLRQRMRASPMPLKEILTICIQAAEALDAAHQAGVIHRDIKPENIMIRKDGYVKVLDFGLAKSIEPINTADASKLMTRSMADTEAGMAIGTVRYMSPEQARGLKLDARTDLFSLGILLYEMIAGRAPFNAPTSQDMLVAILEKYPAPLRNYADVSEELQWIVNKALAKDVDERYQTAKDFLTDLKRVRKRLEVDEELKRSGSTKISTRTNNKNTFIFLALIAVMVVIVGFLLTRMNPKKIEVSKLPFGKIKVTRLTSSGSAWGAAISRDGRYVVYVEQNEKRQHCLFVKQLSADSDIQILTFPENTTIYENRRFSLDGDYIYYATWSWDQKSGTLFQVPVLGGVSRKLIENIVAGLAISPDGKKLTFAREVNDERWLMISQPDGSNQRKILVRKDPDYFRDLEWSPDGKMITAIVARHSPNGEAMKIIGIGLDGSEKWVSNLKWTAEWGPADFEWMSDGSGLILSKGDITKRQIYFLPYPKGELTPITNDPNDYDGVSVSSDSKSIVTTQYSFSSNIWTASMDKPDSIVQRTSASNIDDGSTGISWTADGKILYQSNAPSGDYQIWRMNADGTNRVRLTSDKHDKYWPVASPDGRFVVYNSDEDNLLKLYRIDSDGGNPKLLSGNRPLRFPRISPDSKWILCSSSDLNKQELIKLPIDGSKETVLASHRYITGSAISSDGKKIAYATQDKESNDETTMHIISSDTTNELTSFKLKTDLVGGGRFYWTPDGRAIAYISLEQKPFNIYIQPIDGSPGHNLTNFTEGEIHNFSLSPDGKQIVYSRAKTSTDVVLIQSVP